MSNKRIQNLRLKAQKMLLTGNNSDLDHDLLRLLSPTSQPLNFQKQVKAKVATLNLASPLIN